LQLVRRLNNGHGNDIASDRRIPHAHWTFTQSGVDRQGGIGGFGADDEAAAREQRARPHEWADGCRLREQSWAHGRTTSIFVPAIAFEEILSSQPRA